MRGGCRWRDANPPGVQLSGRSTESPGKVVQARADLVVDGSAPFRVGLKMGCEPFVDRRNLVLEQSYVALTRLEVHVRVGEVRCHPFTH